MGRGVNDPIKENLDIIQILCIKEADTACNLKCSHLSTTKDELLAILEQQHFIAMDEGG